MVIRSSKQNADRSREPGECSMSLLHIVLQIITAAAFQIGVMNTLFWLNVPTWAVFVLGIVAFLVCAEALHRWERRRQR